MEDMKITLERVGKDKVNWFVSGKDMDKMLIDKETAMALQWQLTKEKFEKAIEGMIPIPPREWTYADVVEATAEFEKSKKLF
jgi:hypothetical protein